MPPEPLVAEQVHLGIKLYQRGIVLCPRLFFLVAVVAWACSQWGPTVVHGPPEVIERRVKLLPEEFKAEFKMISPVPSVPSVHEFLEGLLNHTFASLLMRHTYNSTSEEEWTAFTQEYVEGIDRNDDGHIDANEWFLFVDKQAQEHADMFDDMHSIVFVGNPGAGKSTLLNGLMGSLGFRSGTNIGVGLTQLLDVRTLRNTTYIDTPGLADVELREKAAAEIRKALRRGGLYRVAFVITLDNLRIKEADMTTIKLVLEAAREVTRFVIIVNQLRERELDKLASGDGLEALKRKILARMPRKEELDVEFFLMPMLEYAEAADDVLINGHDVEQLWAFLLNLPELNITPELVQELRWKEFEEVMAQFQQYMKEMERKEREWQAERREWQAKYTEDTERQERERQAEQRERQAEQREWRVERARLQKINEETQRRLDATARGKRR